MASYHHLHFMCFGRQFLKSPRSAHLQHVQQVPMHAQVHISMVEALDSRSLYSRLSGRQQVIQSITDLSFHYFVCQLHHADSALSAIELIEEILLHLFSAINGLRLQVSIPVKGNAFQCLDELFHHEVAVSPSIVACLNEMCDMLLWITFPIKLMELRRLATEGHVESINLLSIRLGVQVSSARTFTQLRLNYICYQVLDLFNEGEPWSNGKVVSV